MKHFKKLKKFFKKKPKVNAQVLFFEITILTLVILIAFLISQVYRLYTSQNADFDALPQNSTVFAYSWNPRLDLSFARNIQSNLDLPTLVKIANLEQVVLPKKLYRDLGKFNFSHKTLAYLWIENQLHPVYLFKFDKYFKSEALDYVLGNPKVGDYYISLRKNSFVVSQSQLAITEVLGNSQKITTNNLYIDAIINIPKNSFGQFYIQHKLLNQYLEKAQTILGPLTYTPYVLESFGVTVGSVVPNKDLIYVSTYTNPSKTTSQFPFSTKEFKASLLNDLLIPEGYKFVISSQSVATRIYDFLQKSGFQTSEKSISKIFNNILVSYNLTNATLNVLNEVLDNEFVIAIYPENKFYFIFDPLGPKLSKNLISELTSFMQYFSPKTISFNLPDGFLGRKLVPNDNLQPKTVGESQTIFPLNEIEQSLTLTNLDSYSTLTNLTNLNELDFVSIPKQSYQELLTISDELLFFSQDFLAEFLSDYFDYQDVPTATTATNFFHDGIQTVTILKWAKN